ncbi:unnamed protein product, partial [Polarella glacialis]
AILLGATGIEDCWWSSSVHVSWGILLGGALFDFVYNVSIAFGLSISSPVFVALGSILSVPANLTVDALLHHEIPSYLEVVGAAIVIASFCLLATEPAASAVPETLLTIAEENPVRTA